MLRFKVTIDGNDKIRRFSKLLNAASSFMRGSTTITVSNNAMVFYHLLDAIRVESMFDLKCDTDECFTQYNFTFGDNPEPTLSFNTSIEHLLRALSMSSEKDTLKISIFQCENAPVLRIKTPDLSTVQDIGITFKDDAEPDEFVIPTNSQESLVAVIDEVETLNRFLTACKKLGTKKVTVVLDLKTCDITFNIRTGDFSEVFEMKGVSIKHHPAEGDDNEDHTLPDEMSVNVALLPLYKFCHKFCLSGQSVEFEVVDKLALRLFYRQNEGVYTMYLANSEK